MRDPYLIFGVSRDVDDDTVHETWLRLIREHPPERNSQAFQQIRQAYETLQTRHQRLAYELFDSEPPDLEDLLALALQKTAKAGDGNAQSTMTRPDVDLMRQNIRQSLANARATPPTSDT